MWNLSYDLLIPLFVEWIDSIALARLDSAVTSVKHRGFFLEVLKMKASVGRQAAIHCDSFFDWIALRSLKMKSICIDCQCERLYDSDLISSLQDTLEQLSCWNICAETIERLTPLLESCHKLRQVDLSLEALPYINHSRAVTMLPNSLTSLTVRMGQQSRSQLVAVIGARFPNLREIYFYRCRFFDEITNASSTGLFQRLESVSFVDCLHVHHTVSNFLCNSPDSISRLVVVNSTYTAFSRHCHYLTSLEMSGAHMTSDDVEDVLRWPERLTHLHIKNSQPLIGQCWTSVGSCVKLVSLTIRLGSIPNPREVGMAISLLAYLEDLCIQSNEAVHGSQILVALQHCRRLKKLALENLSIDYDLTVTMLEHCRQLKSVDLVRCSGLSDLLLLAIEEHLPRLNFLQVLDCTYLTARACAELKYRLSLA